MIAFLAVVLPVAAIVIGALICIGGITLMKDRRRNPLKVLGTLAVGVVLLLGGIIGLGAWADRTWRGTTAFPPVKTQADPVDTISPAPQDPTQDAHKKVQEVASSDEEVTGDSSSPGEPRQDAVAEHEKDLTAPVQEASTLEEPYREWTDASGKFTVMARKRLVRDGKIHLEKTDGLVIEVELSKLSARDLKYLTDVP